MSTDVAGQGHGFQRALLLAALELVAKKGQRDSSAGTIYLAIEEPELYQHPAQARSLAATLRGLAEDTNHAIQVAYATHSPMLVEPGKFNQLIRLRHAEGLPVSGHGTTAITANSETVIKKLSGIKSEESVRKQVDKMCPSQLAEAFFADVALLVEGETDKAFFEGIIQKEPNLRARNLAIVDCGGKSNIPLCKAILESLQIHTLIVADTDSDQNCEDKENATSKDRDKCENIKRLNSTLCKVVSVTPSDWPEEGFQADGDLVFLEPNLEKSLKNHWSEWSQACDELVRTGVGYEGKHSLTYKNAAIEADRCPELFQRIIHRLDELSGGKLPLSNP